MKKVFCILLVGLLLFITGCRKIETYVESEFSVFEDTDVTTKTMKTTKSTTRKVGSSKVTTTTTSKKIPTQTQITTTVANPDVPFPSFEEGVIFHDAYLIPFYTFLENPSYGIIYAGSNRSKAEPEEGEWPPAGGWDRAKILQELIDFVGSKEALTVFLSQKGLQVDVQGAVLMDASYVPLTIFIKTAQTPVFITVNEDVERDKMPYEYKAYTYAQYREKYRPRKGKLVVNGKDITDQATVKLYHNTAHVSLLPVLEAVGATVEYNNHIVQIITYQGEKYVLNQNRNEFKHIKEKLTENTRNMFWVDGGFESVYCYKENGEYLVCDGLLNGVLVSMGSNCRVSLDKKTGTVIVKPQ